mmetsp:Transcript_88676/g.275986  ORF Transcript_88676/g.275986 Transcript_88676/m.275986 type:complete len:202 (-) Transcript_88676:48-653(-)
MGKRVRGQRSGRSGLAHQRTQDPAAPAAPGLPPFSARSWPLPMTSCSTGRSMASASAMSSVPSSSCFTGSSCVLPRERRRSSSFGVDCVVSAVRASCKCNGATTAARRATGLAWPVRESAKKTSPTWGNGCDCLGDAGACSARAAGSASPGGGRAAATLCARISSSPGGKGTNIGTLSSQAPAARPTTGAIRQALAVATKR